MATALVVSESQTDTAYLQTKQHDHKHAVDLAKGLAEETLNLRLACRS